MGKSSADSISIHRGNQLTVFRTAHPTSALFHF